MSQTSPEERVGLLENTLRDFQGRLDRESVTRQQLEDRLEQHKQLFDSDFEVLLEKAKQLSEAAFEPKTNSADMTEAKMSVLEFIAHIDGEFKRRSALFDQDASKLGHRPSDVQTKMESMYHKIAVSYRTLLNEEKSNNDAAIERENSRVR